MGPKYNPPMAWSWVFSVILLILGVLSGVAGMLTDGEPFCDWVHEVLFGVSWGCLVAGSFHMLVATRKVGV